MTFDETSFISWATAGGGGHLPVGPGDDGAVLPDGTIVTLDTVVEGVHFAAGTPLDLVARKALGACLSDVCAMGARAEAVFVSAQLPPGVDGRALAAGLVRWASNFDVVLAGGDTVATQPGALALAVTATGHCVGKAPWLRSGGSPGDRLAVSGPLGGAQSGRHLKPVPRADLVAALTAAGVTPRAAMDLSDGLGRDLPRLAQASGTGAVVVAERLPIHPDVAPDRDAVAAGLGDGEDFELLLALAPEGPLPEGLTVIGTLREQEELVLERAGREHPWPPLGFEHVF